MTAFSRRLPGCRRNFFSVHRMDGPRRMKDGSVRMTIFSPLPRSCCHSFFSVRKTACPRRKDDPRRMKGDHRMISSRLHRSCCCHSFFSVRKTACPRKKDGSVRKMKIFSLRLRRCHRSFCAGHSHRCGLRSRFCGLMNILLCCCLHGSDNHRAGRSRHDCRWSNSCDCRKTCTLRQRRMKRQALPSFLA